MPISNLEKYYWLLEIKLEITSNKQKIIMIFIINSYWAIIFKSNRYFR